MTPLSPGTLELGGILNIRKPEGLTSFQVVSRIRRILGEKKVGHCGSLDPMATGVLVVLFGKATARQDELMSGDKVYSGQMRLGIKTDSGDITGKVTESREVPSPAVERIKEAFRAWTGEITQLPPMFSAVKLKGRKLYEYARKGISVERVPRTVTVHSLELLRFTHPSVDFRLRCSKGTYVRTLVEDIGETLGAPATLSRLVREKVGSFSIEQGLDWNELMSMDREKLLGRSTAFP